MRDIEPGMTGEVTDIPGGLVTCFVNGEETGIEGISTEGIRIRLPEKISREDITIKLKYYVPDEACYKELVILCIFIKEEKKEYSYIYTYSVNGDEYKAAAEFIINRYYRYIMLKLESIDNTFSKELCGYPAEKDCEFAESFAAWKNKRIQAESLTRLAEAVKSEGMSFAVCVDNEYGRRKEQASGNGEYQLELFADRIYAGSQFCHNLFPDRQQLQAILERAKCEGKKLTLCFTYLRDELIEETKEITEFVYNWCVNHNFEIEIVVNDFGMFDILEGKQDYFKLLFGVLLNRRRKDPRYIYRKTFRGNSGQMEENQLNQPLFRELLNRLNIERYEYEACGYDMVIPENVCMTEGCREGQAGNKYITGHSLHMPMYQTNTSQYCPLYAVCRYGDRGKQHLVTGCQKYCSEYILAYPEHLGMIGRYNSIFAFDGRFLENPELIRMYKNMGIDRIVWNI